MFSPDRCNTLILICVVREFREQIVGFGFALEFSQKL